MNWHWQALAWRVTGYKWIKVKTFPWRPLDADFIRISKGLKISRLISDEGLRQEQ